jgi:hypothetical protein
MGRSLPLYPGWMDCDCIPSRRIARLVLVRWRTLTDFDGGEKAGRQTFSRLMTD